MKTLLVSFIFLFILVSCNTGPKGPFFWKVEKEGRVIHILGTVHIGVSLESLQCSETISESLEQSVLVWTEGDFQQQVQEVLEAVKEVSVDVSGQSFQNLSEESRSFFKTKMEPEAFEALQQLSYMSLVTRLVFLCLAEHREFLKEQNALHSKKVVSEQKLDVQIQQLAQTKNILQDYLDEDGYFGNLVRFRAEQVSKEQVEKDIRDYDKNCSQEKLVKLTEGQSSTFAKLIESYKKGEKFDVFQIEVQRLRQQGFPEEAIEKTLDHFKHNLLRKRNEIWLTKLLSAHKQEGNTNMFVAAGLAHFQGPFNVLDKLKKEGFSVKRFNSDCQAE